MVKYYRANNKTRAYSRGSRNNEFTVSEVRANIGSNEAKVDEKLTNILRGLEAKGVVSFDEEYDAWSLGQFAGAELDPFFDIIHSDDVLVLNWIYKVNDGRVRFADIS